jgi:hypothetical protein
MPEPRGAGEAEAARPAAGGPVVLLIEDEPPIGASCVPR